MIKFIGKTFKFIFTVFVAFLAFTFIFSLKSNMSFESTISYFKTVSSEILNIDNEKPNINNLENISSSLDNIQITSKNNKYYYNQLDNTGKIIYITLEQNIDNLKQDNYIIDFSTRFNDLLNTTMGQYRLDKAFQSALDAFFYDHPDLFYLDLSNFTLNTKCISIGALKTYTVEISPKYNNYLHTNFSSVNEVVSTIKVIENIKNNIVNNVYGYDTYSKIKYVHDILVNSVEYKADTENTHNIYGAFIEKKVACDGYSKAFKYLLDELDIECILVSGKATNSSGKEESHMWNYVKLNNEWYGVDVTWDDPIINGGSVKDNLRHIYFLKGNNTFKTSHSSSGKISDTGILFNIPILSNTNYKK